MTTRFDWERFSKLMGAAAVVVLGALSVGCGPAPGYEPEPRMPTGYTPAEPLSSEELAARYEADQQARLQAGGEIAIGGAQADEYSDTDPSALTEFKPALEGHGQWIEDATYGTVWQPNESEVGTDFVPYVSAGSWTYDDTYGYTWVSTYDWGWAPFHYGRWVHVGHRGWVWIPGRTYAGAWVTWRYGGPSYGYVGWAPMGPDWYWYRGVAVGWTFGWSPYYVYCPHTHVYDHGVSQHVVQGPPARVHDGNTREYALANPQVGGAGGGDRVLANPQVGGAGGRVAANPRIAGPKPHEIGIPPEKVAATPKDNAGIARAQALGSPHTAVAQGAAPPVQRRAFAGTNGYRRDDVIAGQPSRGPVTRAPSSPALSRLDAVARAPQVQGVAPVPQQRALPELRPTPRTLQPAPGYSATAPSNTPHSSFGPSPSIASRPPMTSSPSISQPPSAFRSPPPSSFSSSSPTFRSSPSFSRPAPSFRSSPSFSSSAPTFRSSPSVSSSPSFRSSSPSVSSSPSFRSSAPSVRSSPSVGSSPSFRSSASPSVRRR